MTVRTEQRRGRRVLIIDIRYRKPNGRRGRYRRDAGAATRAGARAEDRRIKDRIARTGSPFEQDEEATSSVAVSEPTFADVVKRYRDIYMPAELKITTRVGYDSVLDYHLLPRFRDLPISKVDGNAAAELVAELARVPSRRGKTRTTGTRNNVLTVLRSVLRFTVSQGILPETPKGLPPLKTIDPTVLDIPDDQQVCRILDAACAAHRRSFGLMAYAGLRPNELRALRRRYTLLTLEQERVVGGFVTVRWGLSKRQLHTPKTGPREIPIARPLAELLTPVASLPLDAFIATNANGKPWGDDGLGQAFRRVCARLGFDGWSVYCLRHYAITSWLRAGIPVHVVKRMAGHKYLSTTERYVHYLKTDLELAAKRMDGLWESASSNG